MSDSEGVKPGATRFSLPPVPDLIPLAALETTKTHKEDEKGCKRRHVRATDEQRSQRTSVATSNAIDAATTSRRRQRRKRSKSATEPSDTITTTTTNMTDTSANPRVNPIFLWVRQEDTKIVDVKCEDYDKRNRILLTKTAHGWRAIPRMESLNTASPTNNALNTVKRKKRHRKKRAKCKAIGIQVEEQCFKPGSQSDLEDINVESHIPSHTIHVNRKLPSEEDAEEPKPAPASADVIETTFSMSSPLDKLLAVAELELKSVEDCRSSFPDVEDAMEGKNESYLDNLVLDQTHSGLQMAGINYNELQGDYCDYNEDEDNTLVMDDILNRLEQSLGNAEQEILQETMETNNNNNNSKEKDDVDERRVICAPDEQTHTELCNVTQQEEEADMDQTIAACETTAMSTLIADEEITNAQEDVDDILPTDLSCRKRRECDSSPCVSGASYDAPETLQSPEPSGIPAVTPDLCQLTSSSSPASNAAEEPLNLVGKLRKSESPLVSCSEEIRVSSCTKSDLHAAKNVASKDLTAEKTVLEKTPF